MRNIKGFTLVELILYVGVVAIVVTAIMTLGLNVVAQGGKSATQEEVYSSARYISERIKYEIRNARGIAEVMPTSITLQSWSSPTDTIIDQLGSNLRINIAGAGPTNLNPAGVSVTNLTFTNNTSGDNKTKNISYSLAVEAAYTGGSQVYKASTTVVGSAEVRSN